MGGLCQAARDRHQEPPGRLESEQPLGPSFLPLRVPIAPRAGVQGTFLKASSGAANLLGVCAQTAILQGHVVALKESDRMGRGPNPTSHCSFRTQICSLLASACSAAPGDWHTGRHHEAPRSFLTHQLLVAPYPPGSGAPCDTVAKLHRDPPAGESKPCQQDDDRTGRGLKGQVTCRAHGDITYRSFYLERAGTTLLLWDKEAKLESACREPLLLSRDVCVALEIRGQKDNSVEVGR